MRTTIRLWEAVGARMPIESMPTAELEIGDPSTNVPNDVPLLACYRSLLRQASDGKRRAQIVQNNRQSYYSEAATECRAA